MNSDIGNDKAFLKRLTAIIEANLANENFGVSELAQKMDMSRSRLYFRVKSGTRKTVSQFIREIRLNKALELLNQLNLTVSEISYQVGFGSPAYFNKCFHELFGFPPGEAKNHVMAESDSAIEAIKASSIEKKIIKHTSKLLVATGIIIVLLGSFLVYHTLFNSQLQKDSNIASKSIAVLPLKNLSNNSEIQYLADGIMEDILSRLSYVDGLVVKSRISSEKIGDENLTAKEISKE